MEGQEREKQTDSRPEEKRIVLTALEAGRGREARLALCWSRAKGTSPLQWSCISVLSGVFGKLERLAELYPNILQFIQKAKSTQLQTKN